MPVTQFGRLVRASVDDVRSFTDEDGVSVDYRELKKDEFRRGPQWTTAIKVGSAMCDGELVTQNWHPASDDPWLARARALSGQYSPSPARLTPTLTQPDGLVDFVATDYAAGAFPGTLTNVELNQDNELVLSSGQLTGIYTTGELDLGSADDWWLSHKVHVLANDYRWRIGKAIGELSGVTIGELIGTPAKHAIGSAYFSDRDLAGIRIHDPQVTWLLEVTVYDETGVPGTFQEFTPGWYRGRYAQFKLTLTREVGADLAVSNATYTEPIVITTTTDHGMRTGQRVRVRNVGGNTAANGAWPITVVDDDEFSLDGSVGNGAYTSGGVVVKDVDLRVTEFEIAKSREDGPHEFDIRKYGAIAGVNTEAQATINVAAIQAAIDEAAEQRTGTTYGGVAYVPGGEWYVNNSIVVKNRVWLRGDDSFASRIVARSTFPTSTPVIILGPNGGGNVFNCRVWRLGVDCSDISGSTGIYTQHAQEQCGCFDFQVLSYRNYGVHFNNTGSYAASECGVSGFEIAGSDSGSLAGIYFKGVAGGAYIKHGTVNWRNTGTHNDGILLDGGDTMVEDIHVEHHTDGIHVSNSAAANITTVYGHSSVTNLINVDSGCQIVAIDINANSATNILVDGNRGLTWTSAGTGYIPFYSTHEVHIGPAAILGTSQTALVDLTIPDLAGVNDEFVFRQLAQILTNKTLQEPVIHTTGQVAAERITIKNLDQEVSGNVLQIPNIYDNGAGAAATRNFLVDTIDNSGTLVYQETRSLNLVDCLVKYNGQSSPYAYLTSADQTGAGGARIPDLGDAAVHDLAILDLDQTFSGTIKFTGTLAVGNVTPSHRFAIGSADNSDQIDIYHDNTHAYLTWNDGYLKAQTDEGTDTDTYIEVIGKGTGRGILRFYGQSDSYFEMLGVPGGYAYLRAAGTTKAGMMFQPDGACNVSLFHQAASGTTKELKVYGFRTDDALRSLEIGVGVDAADTASYDGVSTHRFLGNLLVDDVLKWPNEESVPFVSSGTHTPTESTAHWYELVSGTMYLCLKYDGTTYDLAMTAR